MQQEKDALDQGAVNEPPVVRFLTTIISEAVCNHASDIHIEPRSDGLCIRYRIDGVLRTAPLTVDRQFMRALIARVKVLANLDVAETRLAQDGRFQESFDGHTIDFRVSVLPTYYGEKAVLRVLDKSAELLELNDLGLTRLTRGQLEDALRMPQGMIVVTGPTGSGKSTTLYAALNHIKSEHLNIVTIEDPIEYQIEGINQTQIHPRIGVTFSNQLRSILRQDPDVILVGEIRDSETAEMSFRAALTGHLVLSTLHTVDAASAITRLLDVGTEPYLIASSVVAVISQRLVRVLCDRCRVLEERTVSVIGPGDRNIDGAAFRASGCDSCHGTGYSGRVGVFELMRMNEVIRHLTLCRASAQEIRQVACRNGMKRLHEQGEQLVRSGTTSLEEWMRVFYGMAGD